MLYGCVRHVGRERGGEHSLEAWKKTKRKIRKSRRRKRGQSPKAELERQWAGSSPLTDMNLKMNVSLELWYQRQIWQNLPSGDDSFSWFPVKIGDNE